MSEAPPSGCGLIHKNPPLPAKYNQSEPRRVSEKCHSLGCIRCWQPLSLMQHVLGSAPPPHRCSVCSHLVRYVQPQTVNNGREQTTTTVLKNAPPLPTSKRRNKKTDKEKQYKKKELDRAREKTRINIGVSFQRWRKLWDL